MLTFQTLAKFRKMLGYSMKGGQAPIVVGVIAEIRFILIHGGSFGVFGVLYNTPHFVRTRNRIDEK